MPNIEPPDGGLVRPAHQAVLAAGTRAWRVHGARRPAAAMNPTAQPDALGGGRFDSLDGGYAYLYVADSEDGAIAETLCRDLPLDPSVERIVPTSAVAGRVLTALTVVSDIMVAALHGPHLSAIGQDLWLTKCEARQYVTTRRWAAAVFQADAGLHGIAYRARHNEDCMAWMLATDPTVDEHPALTVDASVTPLELYHGEGRALLAQVLAAHCAVLASPDCGSA